MGNLLVSSLIILLSLLFWKVKPQGFCYILILSIRKEKPEFQALGLIQCFDGSHVSVQRHGVIGI